MRPARRFSRRRFLAASTAGIAVATLGVPSRSNAQTGAKPMRIVVNFPAGGATDVIARLIADKLRGSYASAVLVENRVGAAGRIGVEHVKNAEPDGTTLLFTPDFPLTVYPHSFRKLAYEPLRDFVPVATTTRSMLALSAGPGLPASVTNVAEYVQWCRANPKLASFATTAPGGTPHFVGVMLARGANVALTAVHYKGGAPALQDLLGSQIPVSVNPVSEILPHARSGKLRVLATTGAKRSRFLPDSPTFVESGYKDIVVESWIGFFAPAKTPTETVTKLAAAIGEALKNEDLRQGLEKFAVEVSFAPPASFASIVKADLDRWGPIVQASGFTAED